MSPKDEVNTECLHFNLQFLRHRGNAWVQFRFKAVDIFSNAIHI